MAKTKIARDTKSEQNTWSIAWKVLAGALFLIGTHYTIWKWSADHSSGTIDQLRHRDSVQDDSIGTLVARIRAVPEKIPDTPSDIAASLDVLTKDQDNDMGVSQSERPDEWDTEEDREIRLWANKVARGRSWLISDSVTVSGEDYEVSSHGGRVKFTFARSTSGNIVRDQTRVWATYTNEIDKIFVGGLAGRPWNLAEVYFYRVAGKVFGIEFIATQTPDGESILAAIWEIHQTTDTLDVLDLLESP